MIKRHHRQQVRVYHRELFLTFCEGGPARQQRLAAQYDVSNIPQLLQSCASDIIHLGRGCRPIGGSGGQPAGAGERM